MSKPADAVADPSIPTLAAVLDPVVLSRQLSLVLPQANGGDVEVTRLSVLKWHKGSRCTLEVALRTTEGWLELIGKVYAEDRPDIFPAMEAIREAGFASEQEFAIARPLAYLAPLRLLLYERVPGMRARELIVGPSEADRLAAVERCARWLARFHSCAPRSGRAFRMEDYLIGWREWLYSSHLDSATSGKAGRLLDQIVSRVPGGKDFDLCAGHGMYTCGQVLFENGRTTIIDWDTFNLADPGHDVARFLVDLKRMALKYFGVIDALDREAKAFQQTYVAEARPDATAHLAFQQAAICLERAKSDVEKCRAGWQERAAVMLDEGLRILSSRSN